MRRTVVIGLGLVVAASAALAIGWHYWGPAAAPQGQDALVELTAENFAQFRSRFNEARGVRVIALLSPT
jgi:hypothetical protein